MLPPLADKAEPLLELCRAHGVARLDLFGSAVGADFDPARSDLDFLVTFAPCSPLEHARRYFGLLAALQDLFGRPVDLVELDAITNPYFLRAVQAARTTVYAA